LIKTDSHQHLCLGWPRTTRTTILPILPPDS
jgi:hypothetical protein